MNYKFHERFQPWAFSTVTHVLGETNFDVNQSGTKGANYSN